MPSATGRGAGGPPSPFASTTREAPTPSGPSLTTTTRAGLGPASRTVAPPPRRSPPPLLHPPPPGRSSHLLRRVGDAPQRRPPSRRQVHWRRAASITRSRPV